MEAITSDIRNIVLDISEEACRPFGFLHGDRVLTASQLTATIMGVAPGNEGENVLWYVIDRLEGRVCYFGSPVKNLKEAGFKKIAT